MTTGIAFPPAFLQSKASDSVVVDVRAAEGVVMLGLVTVGASHVVARRADGQLIEDPLGGDEGAAARPAAVVLFLRLSLPSL